MDTWCWPTSCASRGQKPLCACALADLGFHQREEDVVILGSLVAVHCCHVGRETEAWVAATFSLGMGRWRLEDGCLCLGSGAVDSQ